MDKKKPDKPKDEEFSQDKIQNYFAALSLGVIIVVVGLPLWYKTTDVYRASLPHSDIYDLYVKKISVSNDFALTSFVESMTATDLKKIEMKIKDILIRESQHDEFRSTFRCVSRHSNAMELTQFRQCKTISEFEQMLDKDSKGKMLDFAILPRDSRLLESDVHLGHGRTIYVRDKEDAEKTAQVVAQLWIHLIGRSDAINAAWRSSRGQMRSQPAKEELQSLPFQPDYEITMTLMNPKPDARKVTWDIGSAVDGYLLPFLVQLANMTNFTVNSQQRFFVGLSTTKPRQDPTAKHFYFGKSGLPHMITSMEGMLGSHVSASVALNFVVFVPSPDQSPLYITDEQGAKLAFNSFVSPRWGGIVIYNAEGSHVHVDSRHMMQVVLSQLRQLLGFQNDFGQSMKGISLSWSHPGSQLAEWEIQSWLRWKTIENLAVSTNSLQSLSQLLGKIKNMIINDDIAGQVHTAASSAKKSLELLSKGNWNDAFFASKTAFQCSERAFFDPSLLELLYFPDDQKFAIYVPLFLPIGIPVLISIYHAIKFFTKMNKEKQKTE